MNRKIAIIIERVDIALGGAERSVFELTAELGILGFKVDVLAAKGQTNAKNIHILCPQHPGKRTCYFTFAKALKHHLAENSYDIIHSVLPFDFAHIYQPRGGTFAESIQRNAASYQNKLVESYKKITSFANYHRTILLHAEKKLCKKPDGPLIAALSHYVAWQFKDHYNLDDERLFVIPNGVKTNKKIDTPKAEKLRSQIMLHLSLKEADDPVFFLFAAHNFRLKGLSCLIKALHLAEQKKQERKAYLIVAGNARTHKYRRLAKKLDVHKKIIFLGALRNIQNALSISDVTVLPTFYDPSSRFILESLAAAIPVITTNFNGATDLFENDRHGKVIDQPQNITALAEAISYFTDTNNIKNASQAIIDDNISQEISISRAAAQLASLYESIIEKGRE